MSATEVRAATPADAEGIQRVGHRTWPTVYAFAGQDYVADGLARWWSDEAVARGILTTRTFVLEAGEEVVGMGNIDLRGDDPIIWKLYVSPGHQGSGGGRALMRRLVAEAPAGSDVLLEYTEGNDRAAAFYRRLGFVERRRDAPERPGWPAQVWMAGRAGPVA